MHCDSHLGAVGGDREKREELVKGIRSLADGIVDRYEFISVQ